MNKDIISFLDYLINHGYSEFTIFSYKNRLNMYEAYFNNIELLKQKILDHKKPNVVKTHCSTIINYFKWLGNKKDAEQLAEIYKLFHKQKIKKQVKEKQLIVKKIKKQEKLYAFSMFMNERQKDILLANAKRLRMSKSDFIKLLIEENYYWDGRSEMNHYPSLRII